MPPSIVALSDLKAAKWLCRIIHGLFFAHLTSENWKPSMICRGSNCVGSGIVGMSTNWVSLEQDKPLLSSDLE